MSADVEALAEWMELRANTERRRGFPFGAERMRDAARLLREHAALLDAIDVPGSGIDTAELREWAELTTPYGRKLMHRIADALDAAPAPEAEQQEDRHG